MSWRFNPSPESCRPAGPALLYHHRVGGGLSSCPSKAPTVARRMLVRCPGGEAGSALALECWSIEVVQIIGERKLTHVSFITLRQRCDERPCSPMRMSGAGSDFESLWKGWTSQPPLLKLQFQRLGEFFYPFRSQPKPAHSKRKSTPAGPNANCYYNPVRLQDGLRYDCLAV